MPLSERRWNNKPIFFYRIVNSLLPNYVYFYLDFPSSDNYPLKSASTSTVTSVPSPTKTFQKPFFPYFSDKWNNLIFFLRDY